MYPKLMIFSYQILGLWTSGKKKNLPSCNTILAGTGNTDTTNATKLGELIVQVLLGYFVLEVSNVDNPSRSHWGSLLAALFITQAAVTECGFFFTALILSPRRIPSLLKV
jgi:hypothetical protein